MATTINAGRVRFVSRGTYNNSTQYYLFDLVDYNGSSYIAKENTVGNLPTNTQYWQLIAEKGNTGSTGQTGPVGATGNGIASITKTGTSGLVDTYTITYTNGNTTTFTITNGEDGEVTETELDVLRQKVADQQKVIDQLPQVTGQGTSITLENTIEAQFTKFDVEGNSVQNGTPSPDNEVPILSAGDMGSINEYIRPKQLFNIKTVSNGNLNTNTGAIFPNTDWKVSDFIKIYKLIKITFSWVSNNSYFQAKMCYYDKNKNFISGDYQQGSDKYEHTFTVPENAYYCKLSYSVKVGNTSATRDKIQLEEGTANTDYEEYKEPQTYTIPTQQPMRSIGDVRDCFVKVNGEWYERHNIKEFIADGVNFNCRYMFPSGWFNLYEKNTDNTYTEIRYCKTTPDLVVGNVMCNKLIAEIVQRMTNSAWFKKGISLNVNGSIGIKFDDATEETNTWTKESINSYLAENPFTIQAELENPTDIPCTEEQIQQLENIPSTYKDFTIIQSQDETEAYLEVAGIYDLNNLINN